MVAPWFQRLLAAAAPASLPPGRLEAVPSSPASELALVALTQHGSIVTVAPAAFPLVSSGAERLATQLPPLTRVWSNVSSRLLCPSEPLDDLSFCD